LATKVFVQQHPRSHLPRAVSCRGCSPTVFLAPMHSCANGAVGWALRKSASLGCASRCGRSERRSSSSAHPVTVENFLRAESDRMFAGLPGLPADHGLFRVGVGGVSLNDRVDRFGIFDLRVVSQSWESSHFRVAS